MTAANSPNQTETFLGHRFSWGSAGIVLADVQPLYGGVRVNLPTYSSAQALITHIAPGGKETKRCLWLEWKEKEALCRLFIEQDFLTIQPQERAGLPDEARPAITLTNRQGERHTVAKWAGVADPRFDALYEALLALSRRTERVKEIEPKLAGWQKGLFLSGLGLLLLAAGVTAVWLARWWAAVGQPEWQLAGLAGLMALAIIGLRLLAWRERRLDPWLRPFTNPPTVALASLLLAGGGIGVWGLAESWLAGNDQWDGYVVWGYTAVFTLYIWLTLAAFIGKKIMRFVDERF